MTKQLKAQLWLEQFLQNWSGSFVLVSHDRSLLDNVTNCSWILRDKTLQFFRLPCTAARSALVEKDRADAHRHLAEQTEIDRVAKSAKRLAIWGNHLDLEGKEQLAETLKNFSGAIILVFHDRTLIEKSCNRFWLIDNQRLEQWQDLESVCAT